MIIIIIICIYSGTLGSGHPHNSGHCLVPNNIPCIHHIFINRNPRQSLYLTSLMYSYSKLGIPKPGTYTDTVSLVTQKLLITKHSVFPYTYIILFGIGPDGCHCTGVGFH